MSTIPLTERQERLLRIIETSVSKRGYVPTLEEMAQAMDITSLQGVKDHLTALERKGYLRRTPGRRRAIEVIQPITPIAGSIPILGRVAAGRPLLAVENHEGSLSLDNSLLGDGSHFALRVQGDSMIEVGITEGDYVIVRQQATANPGDIVVALLGEEVTVKRLRKKGAALLLEAANPAYEPIPLTGTSPAPRILGVAVGQYRALRQRR
ncbi:MAG: transcriptional repressor LexA [Deltaproteobacteria bacterium]|nr:transcriptional repressor LexA [Deltaproteobacteria bacterium]